MNCRSPLSTNGLLWSWCSAQTVCLQACRLHCSAGTPEVIQSLALEHVRRRVVCVSETARHRLAGSNHNRDETSRVGPSYGWITRMRFLSIGCVRAHQGKGVTLTSPPMNLRDKRRSDGCVVVPELFYTTVIEPVLGRSRAILYFMPESSSWQDKWPKLGKPAPKPLFRIPTSSQRSSPASHQLRRCPTPCLRYLRSGPRSGRVACACFPMCGSDQFAEDAAFPGRVFVSAPPPQNRELFFQGLEAR